FYPVYHISELIDDEEAALEELYQMIRAVFAPTSKQKAMSLKLFFLKYDKRRRWLNASPEAKRWSLDEWNGKALAQHFADYIAWRESSKGKEVRYKGEQFRALLSKLLLAHQQPKRELVAFIESQVALTKALFNFREAWQGPSAMVYDPQHLLSSEDT